MLTKDEEQRLASIQDVVNQDIKLAATSYAEDFKLEVVQWLAEKLKEVNDECRLTTAGLNLVVETVRDQLIKGEI